MRNNGIDKIHPYGITSLAISNYLYIIALLFANLAFISCTEHTGKGETSQDWAAYGYDNSGSKYSPLHQVNTSNVHQLKEVWRYVEKQPGGSSIFFNPLIANGKMFAFMPSNKLVALEPASGALLWEFTPDSTSVRNWLKGITFHEGDEKHPDILLFIHGSTLYSINAGDGSLNKTFGASGKVDFYEGLDVPDGMRDEIPVTSNAPGIVYKDLFIVGCKVPDELPSVSGDIRAFNIFTGTLEWIFHTIPKPGEFGADSWAENARQKNGGANCWGGMALDEERGIVYVPTASPSFDFYGADRPGQNLFANCLIALDAATGKRIWHFQTTHHDLWDRDNGSPPNLVKVFHDGDSVDAVALATKVGYVFVFDRDTGAPLFPIEEVPVPTKSEMPGEEPWPTQPIPTKPPAFARQGFSEDLITDLTTEATKYVKEQLEKHQYNTGIYEPPNMRGSVIVPAAHGGANWGGASLNPETGVLFVNSTDLPWLLKMIDNKTLASNNELKGIELYNKYCSSCHGVDKKGTNYGPNIGEKVKGYSSQQLVSVMRAGIEPMPSFKHLPAEQLFSIASYLKALPKDSIPTHVMEEAHQNAEEPYSFSGYNFFTDHQDLPAIKPPWGTLTAIDLNQGEILWQVPLGENKKLAQEKIPSSGMYNRGGGIATAGGLIFIAATGDRMIRAFDQESGNILWEADLPGNGYAIPSTYAINGKQYLTIAVSPNSGNNFPGGYVTFSIVE